MSLKFTLLIIVLFVVVGFGAHWATNSPEPVVEQQMDELDMLEEELKKEEE